MSNGRTPRVPAETGKDLLQLLKIHTKTTATITRRLPLCLHRHYRPRLFRAAVIITLQYRLLHLIPFPHPLSLRSPAGLVTTSTIRRRTSGVGQTVCLLRFLHLHLQPRQDGTATHLQSIGATATLKFNIHIYQVTLTTGIDANIEHPAICTSKSTPSLENSISRKSFADFIAAHSLNRRQSKFIAHTSFILSLHLFSNIRRLSCKIDLVHHVEFPSFLASLHIGRSSFVTVRSSWLCFLVATSQCILPACSRIHYIPISLHPSH